MQKGRNEYNELSSFEIISIWCSIRLTHAFTMPAIYSCFFHSCNFCPCNFDRIAFSTAAFSVAPILMTNHP